MPARDAVSPRESATAAHLEDYVQRVPLECPPLTPELCHRIAALLWPSTIVDG